MEGRAVPRSIPSETPRLLFEAEAPLHSTPWMDRPVISGGTILLAGGGIDIPPSVLTCYETGAGTRLWREIARGTVSCVLHAPHVVLFVETDGAGRRLIRIDARDGSSLGASRIEGNPGEPLTILAADHTHALWADGRRLVCEVLADPGRCVWELEIPAPARAGIKGMAVAAGHIVARVKNRIWAWG